MNTIQTAFEGTLGQDAELKHVKNGELALASFSMAVGEGDDNTQWVRVALFGSEAQALVHRLTKGTKVYCEGKLTLNTWQGRDGQQHTGLNVSAWTVQPLGQIGKRKPRKSEAPKKPGVPTRRPPLERAPTEDFNDPIPF